MIRAVSFALFVAAGSLLLYPGCGESTRSAEADFVPGAFPPILTDTEYHARSWTRTDCMTCHEKGIQDAPKMKHVSLAPLAKESSCRTCHVFVPGSQPRP